MVERTSIEHWLYEAASQSMGSLFWSDSPSALVERIKRVRLEMKEEVLADLEIIVVNLPDANVAIRRKTSVPFIPMDLGV